jgi:hypothetical protein
LWQSISSENVLPFPSALSQWIFPFMASLALASAWLEFLRDFSLLLRKRGAF